MEPQWKYCIRSTVEVGFMNSQGKFIKSEVYKIRSNYSRELWEKFISVEVHKNRLLLYLIQYRQVKAEGKGHPWAVITCTRTYSSIYCFIFYLVALNYHYYHGSNGKACSKAIVLQRPRKPTSSEPASNPSSTTYDLKPSISKSTVKLFSLVNDVAYK